MRHPTPQQIKEARVKAGLTQMQAAELVHKKLRTWQDWEHKSGKYKIDLTAWELFLILVKNNLKLRKWLQSRSERHGRD